VAVEGRLRHKIGTGGLRQVISSPLALCGLGFSLCLLLYFFVFSVSAETDAEPAEAPRRLDRYSNRWSQMNLYWIFECRRTRFDRRTRLPTLLSNYSLRHYKLTMDKSTINHFFFPTPHKKKHMASVTFILLLTISPTVQPPSPIDDGIPPSSAPHPTAPPPSEPDFERRPPPPPPSFVAPPPPPSSVAPTQKTLSKHSPRSFTSSRGRSSCSCGPRHRLRLTSNPG